MASQTDLTPAADRSAATDSGRLSWYDVFKSFVIWTFFSHSNYNYERLQATAFAHSMTPIIAKLYSSQEERAAALKRHLTFFNTEPNFGGVIHGITIAMEEERAAGADISDESINSLKTGLMGPMAGIGDTLTQGTITPLLLALGISLGSQGNLAGPILYIVLEAVIVLGIAYIMWFSGYRAGRNAVTQLLSSGTLNTVVSAASVLGLTVLGALAAQFVSFSTPAKVQVGQQIIPVQTDILDKLMPGLLPLGLLFLCWWLLRRGWNPLWVIGLIVVVGAVGGVLGVF